MKRLALVTSFTFALFLFAACGDSATEPIRVDEPETIRPRSHLAPCTDVTLRTQAEVDAFDCSVVTGNLSIENIAALTNVDGLSGVTSVAGNLLIHSNAALTNVDGHREGRDAADGHRRGAPRPAAQPGTPRRAATGAGARDGAGIAHRARRRGRVVISTVAAVSWL